MIELKTKVMAVEDLARPLSREEYDKLENKDQTYEDHVADCERVIRDGKGHYVVLLRCQVTHEDQTQVFNVNSPPGTNLADLHKKVMSVVSGEVYRWMVEKMPQSLIQLPGEDKSIIALDRPLIKR